MTKKSAENQEQIYTLTVFGTGHEGDLIATTPKIKGKIYVVSSKRIALDIGDEFVGQVFKNKGEYRVKPIAKTSSERSQDITVVYGIVEKRGDKYYLTPSEKNQRLDYLLNFPNKAKHGDYVRVELVGRGGFREARVVKNFGTFDLNKATATLVLERYGIPYIWRGKIEKELVQLPEFDKEQRVDLTDVPLVTIDGDDSKDFDDAVWAEETPSGFNLMVAIADVAFYVREGSVLDEEAYLRGNSVYLPNLTVPMLPEKLSNDLCSLMPNRPRLAIVCMMRIDKEGRLVSYDFVRAVIRSAARLTYQEVQKAIEGEKTPLLNKVIPPLYKAYKALNCERQRRGALELETTEIKIKIDKNGKVLSIAPEERFESYRLIEEFMIAANNATALFLQKAKVPTMFRVHDKPREEKMEEMRPLLYDLKMKLPEVPALKPEHFNKLISICASKGYVAGISELVLRMQSQAQYSPKNIGHFGLGLKDYVHFTSPIRRYADLLVHRALIKVQGWGETEKVSQSKLEEIAEHLCETERRAVNAERDIAARFVSSYLEPVEGQEFEVQISGLSTAGIFVRIATLGAEGLIPMTSLPDDDYVLENGCLRLCGKYSGLEFSFGEIMKARLIETSPISGGLIFRYIDTDEGEEYAQKGNRKFYFSPIRKSQKKEKKKCSRKQR